MWRAVGGLFCHAPCGPGVPGDLYARVKVRPPPSALGRPGTWGETRR